MQQFNRTATKQWGWGAPNILQKRALTTVEGERKKRVAQIEAAVWRMKFKAEGRLK